MPTYQYACTECGDRVDVVQKFTDPALTECGSCGGRLRKVFSPVGVVFKGSGFYRTDSRSASNGSSTKEKAEDGAESAKNTADGKKDAGGEAKTDGGDSPAKSSAGQKSEHTTKKDATKVA